MSSLLTEHAPGAYRINLPTSDAILSFKDISDIYNAASRIESGRERNICEKRVRQVLPNSKLAPNSLFRHAIENNCTQYVVDIVMCGLVEPNGTVVWSSYFSKIDFDEDGYLFEGRLRYICGGLCKTIKQFCESYKDESKTVMISSLQYARGHKSVDEIVDEINSMSSAGTSIIIIGLTDSRDYSTFEYACATAYGHDNRESGRFVTTEFARDNFQTFVDVLCDAAKFVRRSNCRIDSSCPGIKHWNDILRIDEISKCILHVSKMFSDSEWERICTSHIWHLVKDVVALRKFLQQTAA